MNLLLWTAFKQKRLSAIAVSLISIPSTSLWFSVVSIWEVAIKRGQDLPDFRVEPGVLRAGLPNNGYQELAIEEGWRCL